MAQKSWCCLLRHCSLIQTISESHREVHEQSGLGGNLIGITRYACVDGGTRLEAISMRFPGLVDDNKKPINLRCEVLPASRKVSGHFIDEAESFLGAQDEQRAPSSNDAFKARLYKREHAAVRTFNVAEKAGITIRFREPEKSLRLGDNETRHGGVFYWAFQELAEKRYKFMVSLLAMFAYDDEDGYQIIETKALQGAFIRGMTRFLVKTNMTNDEIARGILSALMVNNTSAAEIVEKAHLKTRSGFQRPKTVSDQIKLAILEGIRVS